MLQWKEGKADPNFNKNDANLYKHFGAEDISDIALLSALNRLGWELVSFSQGANTKINKKVDNQFAQIYDSVYFFKKCIKYN